MKFVLFAVLVAVLSFAICSECRAVGGRLTKRDVTAEEWEAYKKKYGKSYPTAEIDNQHFEIYKSSVAEIAAHNAKFDKGEVLWTMGINHFADLPKEEFRRMYPLNHYEGQ